MKRNTRRDAIASLVKRMRARRGSIVITVHGVASYSKGFSDLAKTLSSLANK